MTSSKIKQTSPDKVNGKSIKYKRGDCLAIRGQDSNYIGVIISEKFNAYYDLTLIEFLRIEKSKNAQKFSDLGFVSKHLIEVKYIMESSSS